MKICCLNILLLLFVIFSAEAPVKCQEYLDSLEAVITNNTGPAEFTLVIYSSLYCGFCQKLRKDFQGTDLPENLKIIFIEKDSDPDKIRELAWSYRNADVYIPVEGASDVVTFFPSSFLYDSTGKRIRKFKGYKSDFWLKVIREVL